MEKGNEQSSGWYHMIYIEHHHSCVHLPCNTWPASRSSVHRWIEATLRRHIYHNLCMTTGLIPFSVIGIASHLVLLCLALLNQFFVYFYCIVGKLLDWILDLNRIWNTFFDIEYIANRVECCKWNFSCYSTFRVELVMTGIRTLVY